MDGRLTGGACGSSLGVCLTSGTSGGNIIKHGIDFESARRFDWATASFERSMRRGEERVFALGYNWEPAARRRVHRARRDHPHHQPAEGEPEGGESLCRPLSQATSALRRKRPPR